MWYNSTPVGWWTWPAHPRPLHTVTRTWGPFSRPRGRARRRAEPAESRSRVMMVRVLRAPSPDSRSVQLEHLDPCQPDLEFRTFDIERHIRYRRLRYQMLIRYRRSAPSISYVDIEGVRCRRSNHSISKVPNLRYRRSWTRKSISRFHAHRYR